MSTIGYVGIIGMALFLAWDYYRHRKGQRTFSREFGMWQWKWKGLAILLFYTFGYLSCHLTECFDFMCGKL